MSPNDPFHQFPILRNPLFKLQSKKILPWTQLSSAPPGKEESSYLWRKISGLDHKFHLDPGEGGENRLSCIHAQWKYIKALNHFVFYFYCFIISQMNRQYIFSNVATIIKYAYETYDCWCGFETKLLR